MRRGALARAAFIGAVTGLVVVACGVSVREESPEGAQGGEAGLGGVAGLGGEDSPSGSGGDTIQTGGTGEASGAGGTGARGGTAGRGGASGGSGGRPPNGGTAGITGGTSSGAGAGGIADGGAAGAGEPDIVICDRFTLYQAGVTADRIRISFERTTFQDCRLNWFLSLYLPPVNQRAEFGTNFKAFTLGLWGCLDVPAPTEFKLIHTPVPLSPAEARALIDLYLDLSRIEAELSPREATVVERQLERLAEPLIDPTLDDFSRSTCPGDGGGGQGGAPGGAGAPP